MKSFRTENSSEIILPARVALITAVISAVILVMSQLYLYYLHYSTDTELTGMQVTVTALFTSAVAVPVVGYFVYVSQDALANLRRLERISRIDSLSGLLNRRSFDEQANGVIWKLGLDKSAGTMLFIDVDHFKSINEEFGHGVGDKILAAIGTSLTAGTHPTDVVGRFGADEFGVLLPDTDLDDALIVAERLHRTIAQNCHLIDLGDRDVTVSIGVASHRADTSLAECIRAAYRRLTVAKETGRDKICANLLQPVA